ncbi:MAG: hypothetical protein WD960_00270 [Gemmatimonadota bacterium]
MKKWLRPIRGAIGTGLTWAAAWFGAGMVMLLGLLMTTGSTGADVPYPLGFGALGFVAGVTFSVVLRLAEGRRRFDEMSLPRFAAWGGVGGLLFSAIFVGGVALAEGPSFLGNLVVLGPVFALAGAGSAAGSLALARRAEGDDLPAARGSFAELPLSADEAQNRIGGGTDAFTEERAARPGQP